MAQQIDWEHTRTIAYASVEPPSDWPKGVRPISIEGTSLFGLDGSNRLYWDGEAVVVKRMLDLRWWQTALLVVATIATVVQAGAAVKEAFFTEDAVIAASQDSAS